jgi:hypothetical protein
MMDFPQLWMKGERTFFPRLRNRLRRNAVARAAPSSQEAVTQLDGIGRRYTTALNETMMSFVDPSRPLVSIKNFTAEDIINNWLYAGAMHWDEEKVAFVERWSKVSYEFQLSKAIHALCDSYWELDLLVQRILNEPSLLMSRETGDE